MVDQEKHDDESLIVLAIATKHGSDRSSSNNKVVMINRR